MRGRKEGKTPIVCANESCRSFSRAFFGSIPEDFGNRGESTITKLPTRNKQWQKHHKKDQTTANRMTVFFFYEVGTAVWPREFYHGNLLSKQSGKTPVAIPRFLLCKNNNKHRHSIRRGLVLWCFCHCLFLIGNLVMVDSPRFPKSSAINPKKALIFSRFQKTAANKLCLSQIINCSTYHGIMICAF